jgi:hypothetical protein
MLRLRDAPTLGQPACRRVPRNETFATPQDRRLD